MEQLSELGLLPMFERNHDNINCISPSWCAFTLVGKPDRGRTAKSLPKFQAFLRSNMYRNNGVVHFQLFQATNESVEWVPGALIPLCAYLKHCFGRCTGIGFVDSTSVKVCHNRRISRNKVFKDFATRGKTSVDWFFGFKLHIAVNEHGEIFNAIVTPGNIDDRKPIPDLLSGVFGKIFADRGYVSKQLAEQLLKEFGIEFFACASSQYEK